MKVNCSAIPEGLFESELFGHMRGAFSGADRERRGRFLTANGGTLLLDEIGDLPLSVLSKLLRVLQEGTFEPLGSDRTTRVDVRVLAATHVDLEAAIAERRYFEAVLKATGDRLYGPGGASEITGLRPTTLRSRLVKLGLR